nr:unnamed protein product [Callosobruchus analis]
MAVASVVPLSLVSSGPTVVQGPSSQAAVIGPDGGVVASSNIGGSIVAPASAGVYTLPAPVSSFRMFKVNLSKCMYIAVAARGL